MIWETRGETRGRFSCLLVIKTVYTFDNDGNIVSEYVYSEDTGNTGVEGEESGIHPHSGDGGAGVVSNINNLILGHNFEDLIYWKSMDCNCEDIFVSDTNYEPYAKFGKTMLRIHSTNSSAVENGVYQDTVTLPVGEYTFSVYMRVRAAFTADNAGAYIRVTDAGGNVLAESEHIKNIDTEYIRLVAPFELTAAQSVRVHILVDGIGTINVDAAQLENNPYANAYNMLENGNFENDLNKWSISSGVTTSTDTRFNMTKSMQMSGDLASERYAEQYVKVKTDRSTRETFTLSGWAKGNGIVKRERENIKDAQFRLRAKVKYYDTHYRDYGTEEFVADFSPCTEEWQFASIQFAKSKYRSIECIYVYCDYDYNSGTVYFDDIQLIRDSIETGLSADDFNEETADTDNTSAAVEEAEPTTEQTEDTNEFKELIDAYGNAITETTFTDGEFGTIYRAFGFTPNCNGVENAGNDLVCETDARGNTTEYTVDEETSRNEVVTDRCGNKTAYEYDKSGKTTKVTSKNASDVELANVSYAYDAFDNMTEIVRGDGMKYVLAYNAFHNLESIAVKGDENNEDINLIKYTYKNGNGRLKEIAYANGDKMKATYNGIGQMIAEKWYNSSDELTAHYKYVYDGQGNIVRSIDILREKEYNYLYENDKIMQSKELDITLDSNGFIVSRSLVNNVQYYYDTENTLTKKRILSFDGLVQTVTYEKAENDSQVVRFTAGGRTVTSHSKTDSFGRKVFDELQLGKGFVSRQFSYHKGVETDEHVYNNMLKSSPTTQLVSQIVLSDGRTLSYEYDPEERITSVTESYKVGDDTVTDITAYTYDALGQLVTETVNGITTKFEYDNYGNILAKGVVDETGEIAEETKVTYVYGDDTWKDLLTVYNGQSISYDAQGNPTSYLGHTLTWEKGRQLKKFVKADETEIEYTYNANGIRTSKKVDGVLHTYTLDGTKILRETWGNNTLIPLYDNEDSVCGIEYNGTAYYFLKNLQGDIVTITDKNGQAVARYTYDAWGVPAVTQDNSGCDIANINPFRYRGYYYDVETKLYYLQSRYYNAKVGRFVNGDEVEYLLYDFNVLKVNLFNYCLNNSVNCFDPDGNDAVLVLDHTRYGLPIVGHVALCFEDRNGKWHYTEYTASLNGNIITMKRSAKVFLYPLGNKAKKRFFDNVTYVGARNGTVPIYIRGDFKACHSLSNKFNGSNLGGYHILYNNCLHYIHKILSVAKCTNRALNSYFRIRQTVPALFVTRILSFSYDYKNIQIVRTSNFDKWIKIKKKN